MNDDKLLLSPKEAAQKLGIGRSKIYELAASRELPVVRIGKLVKFSPGSLNSWIKAAEKKSKRPV